MFAFAAPFFCLAATPEPTKDQVRFFEEKVRPILAENCYKCHGSEQQKGSLRLDLREAALAGGEDGPVIVPGKPEESVLVEAIKWESLEMPPTGKLNETQIATLTEWIRLGAPMPKDHGGGSGVAVRKTRGVITDEDRQWWAFQPIKRAQASACQSAIAIIWSQSPIDRFVAAESHAARRPCPRRHRPTAARSSAASPST